MENTQKKTVAAKEEATTKENVGAKTPVKEEETEMIKILPGAAKGNTEVYININGREKYIPVGENVKVTKAEKKILERAEYI